MSHFLKNDNASWEVLNDRVAVKNTDLSSLKYNEIRITNEVKDFFCLANMEKHERRDINLHYGKASYPCVVYLDSYERGRGKIRWGRKFRALFSELISGYFFENTEIINPPLMRFYKKDYLNYEVSFVFIKEIIENTVEVDERVLNPLERHRIFEENFKWRIDTFKYHGSTCSICGFDYIATYGTAGKGRCRVHLKNRRPEEDFIPDIAKDMIPVCSNCYEIIQSGLSSDDLQSLFRISKEISKYR